MQTTFLAAQMPPDTTSPTVQILSPTGRPHHQGRACQVADPTGTPLNVRENPAGKIIASLPNGANVIAHESTRDTTGKEWVRVDMTGIRGWVLRVYVRCV